MAKTSLVKHLCQVGDWKLEVFDVWAVSATGTYREVHYTNDPPTT